MMSMPFLIQGGLSVYFYYQVRRARANATLLVARTVGEEVIASARSH
jgi:hypothetical protein